MVRKLVLRGILAGAIAGAAAFVFAWIFAEPEIDKAIGYEEGRDAAQAVLDKAAGLPAPQEETELFSRAVQGNLGIGIGIILFGVAMGALFAVAYSVCLGRVGNVRARNLALLVAAGGFLGMYLVPFVKYPANPPAVGRAETIGDRGGLYLLLVLCSLVLLVLAVWLGKRLAARLGNWTASLLAGAAFLVAIGIVMAVLPPLGHLAADTAQFGERATETPLPLKSPDGTIAFPGFPADVLFDFRFYSVSAQLILWTALGLIFAPLAGKVLGDRNRHAVAPAEREKAVV